jgi:hypothetical protein
MHNAAEQGLAHAVFVPGGMRGEIFDHTANRLAVNHVLASGVGAVGGMGSFLDANRKATALKTVTVAEPSHESIPGAEIRRRFSCIWLFSSGELAASVLAGTKASSANNGWAWLWKIRHPNHSRPTTNRMVRDVFISRRLLGSETGGEAPSRPWRLDWFFLQ